MTQKRRARARAKPVEAAPEVITSVPVSTPVPISVGSLREGEQFEYEGERYRRLSITAGKVVVLHLTNPERGWIGVTQKAFDPATLVIKK